MATLTTIEGVYRNGKIELSETPSGIENAEVVVTFLDTPESPSEMIRFGMFPGPNITDEADFKLAEWRGQENENGD